MGGALTLLTQKNSPINYELAGPEATSAEDAAGAAVKEAIGLGVDKGESTGLQAWDRIVGLMRMGEYTVIGAKTGAGKTAMGLTIAGNVAMRGSGVLYCATADMTAKELMLRQACSWAAVSAKRAYDQVLTPSEKTRLVGAMGKFRELPLKIDPVHSKSVQAIGEQVKRVKVSFAKKGKRLRLLVVDYVQEVTYLNPPKEWSEERMLRNVSRILKEIATMEGIHILGLVQTHAPPPVKKGEKVQRSSVDSIQNCKAIAKPASTVGFIERQKDERGFYPARGKAVIALDKARWGGAIDVPVIFDGGLGRFEDDPEEPIPEEERGSAFDGI